MGYGWAIAAGCFVGLLLLIPFTTLRVHLTYRRKEKEDHVFIRVKWLGGLIRFQYEVPLLDTENSLQAKTKTTSNIPGLKKRQRMRITLQDIKRAKERWSWLRRRVADLYRIIRRFLSRVTCERLTWTTRLGTGDAADTGVLTGIAWGVKSTLVGVAGSYIRWKTKPDLQVTPHFTDRVWQTELDCIIRFRIGHAMLALICLLVHMRWKGDERTWQKSIQFKG
ncbi:hypothetical protein GCM10011571_10340 [Marinithermofilum abyssi]|uniref:DUF2953 domain-containing protein n=1 Tax=Marinithermofilum abyssi TaxID=1571185 RepID=A0A8J2VEQ8_9BACL|nr:DUF2953 domain-containing protein [Marinithermofilum abyssi]GGE10959.1 hypothetical protein GCM10011571_10340 [Marinithermofilum abyssi]